MNIDRSLKSKSDPASNQQRSLPQVSRDTGTNPPFVGDGFIHEGCFAFPGASPHTYYYQNSIAHGTIRVPNGTQIDYTYPGTWLSLNHVVALQNLYALKDYQVPARMVDCNGTFYPYSNNGCTPGQIRPQFFANQAPGKMDLGAPIVLDLMMGMFGPTSWDSCPPQVAATFAAPATSTPTAASLPSATNSVASAHGLGAAAATGLALGSLVLGVLVGVAAATRARKVINQVTTWVRDDRHPDPRPEMGPAVQLQDL